MKPDSTSTLRARAVSVTAVLLLFVAAPGLAQTPFGAIEGVVRDTSQGVLPGVTVEATSPALIERARSIVSDSTGQYQFLRLPVGEYELRFSLPGFRTVVRGNVVINADFTATINADLGVGDLTELVTVKSEAPVVDVRTTTGQLVITADVANVIPSSRNATDMVKFVLGASQSSPDVGGSTSYSYTPMKVHGSKSDQRTYFIDGILTDGYSGTGDAPNSFGGTGAKEETDYQTNAIPAAFAIGGVVMNTVTKSGGNLLSGSLFANTFAMQSSNLTDSLRALGVKATSGSTGSYDVDGSIGGPIRKDKAWFFGAARVYSFSGLVANSFNPDGAQAFDYVRRWDFFEKVSLNVSENNKLSISTTNDTLLRPYRRDSTAFYTLEANVFNYYKPNQQPMATWTGTHGNAWLYELQGAYWWRAAPRDYRPEVGPNDVTRFDIVTNTYSGAGTVVTTGTQYGSILNGSVTRVGNWMGSHQLRTGFQSNWGAYKNEWLPHGDIILRFRNGVPDSVQLANTPAFNNAWIQNIGAFVQDSWRINRLTINAGLRFDQYRTGIPDESSPAGTWVPAREFAAKDVQTWRDTVPRVGVAYDLTGDARTVVKGSFSKYVMNEGTGLDDSVNPFTESFNLCTWTNPTGGPNAPAPTTMAAISRCGGFPEVNTTLDPNLKRPINTEYSLGIQRQLTAKFAGSITYYRRENRDQFASANLAVPLSGYVPVTIANPLTNQPLIIYNQNPATTGLQQNVITNSSLLDDTFNGVEFAIQRRFSSESYLQGGYAYGKDTGRTNSSDLNDPNNGIFSQGAVGMDEPHQVKLSGATMLPGRVSVSAFFQAYTGLPRQTVLSVGRALVPTLTRASQNVPLEANDASRYPAVELLDLRIGRRFAFGSRVVEAFADAYNLLNANTVLAQTTTYGSSLGQVSQTISPRLVRVGARLSF